MNTVTQNPDHNDVPAQAQLSPLGLWRFLWHNKWLLILITALAAVASVAFAITRTPVYRADILVQIDEVRGGSSVPSGLSGLGSLASVVGIGGGDSGLREEALATLSSRVFTQDFIEKYELLPLLFPEVWDAESSSWTVPDEEVPSIRDAYELFHGGVRTILEDRERGMITIRVEWTDRLLATKWASYLLRDLDSLLRAKEIASATNNIGFLNEQLNETSIAGVQQSIYQLMEAQIERKMLANSREYFVFQVIDPASVPDEDEYVRPKRALIAVVGTVMGFFFALAICIIRTPVGAQTRVD